MAVFSEFVNGRSFFLSALFVFLHFKIKGSEMTPVALSEFDAVKYLDSPERTTAYAEAVLEDGNPKLLAAALCGVARAAFNRAAKSKDESATNIKLLAKEIEK